MTPGGLRLSAALLAGVLTAGGCGILGPEIDDRGVVRFLDLEGGCWVLDAGSERYDPINLPDDFRVDGLRVRFEAQRRRDLAGFCPGEIVEIESIERVR